MIRMTSHINNLFNNKIQFFSTARYFKHLKDIKRHDEMQNKFRYTT